MQVLASHRKSQDVLIDVGGGGGRVSLAMAPLCSQVINVEPSAGMGAQFELARAEAEITDARWIQTDWLNSVGIVGDVVFTRNVTFFVADIETFIDKMRLAASRRVMIGISSTPPPNQYATLVQLVYGDEPALVPGYRELLPVIWDMGILPEVLVPSDEGGASGAGQNPTFQTREKAMDFALQGSRLNRSDRPRARGAIEEHFRAFQ